MKVMIMGPGRIGVPIGNCARNIGHDVTILARPSSRPGDVARAAAVKKWDWLRADVRVSVLNQVVARCLSQFFHNLAAGFEVSIDPDDEPWDRVDLLIFAAATEDRSKYTDLPAVQHEFAGCTSRLRGWESQLGRLAFSVRRPAHWTFLLLIGHWI